MGREARGGLMRLFRGRSSHPRDEAQQPAEQQQPVVEVERTRACPHCGEHISRGATVCLFCERELTPVMNPGEFAVRFGTLQSAQSERHGEGPPHE